MKTNIAFGYSPLTQVKWSDDVAERFPTGIASRAAPGAVGRSEGQAGRRCAGRIRALPRTPRRSRQAAAARPGQRAPRPGQSVPGDRTAGRGWHVRRRMPGRRHDRRHRPGVGPRMHDRRQRRDGERRHVLPDHGQEAPAGTGDRQPEPAAVRVSRRLRRRVPASPGRGVPRPRTLRPHLLQSGQHVGAGHPADRRGPRLLHRRWRVRPRDERRGRHRPQPGHHLPGRPAPGESRYRRSGFGRGPRRWRPALQDLRRHRPPGARRPRRTAHRAPHRLDVRAARAGAVGRRPDGGRGV